MSSIAKTIVATGASSGIVRLTLIRRQKMKLIIFSQGFEAMKQLLAQSSAYKIVVGARNTKTTQAAYDDLEIDTNKHAVTVLPLDLSDLKGVRTFAQKSLEVIGDKKLDFLLLNAGISTPAEASGPNGSKWCESQVVNHLCKLAGI